VSKESITEILANYVVRTEYSDLPDEVVSRAKLSLLDWVGVSIAGSGLEAGELFIDALSRMEGDGCFTVVNDRRRLTCLGSVLTNGVLSSLHELDEVHKKASFHASVATMPVVLAMTEHEHVTGKDLLTSIVLAHEASTRIAEMTGKEHYAFWHTTSTCGVYGACVAASKLLTLSLEQTVAALGLAGAQSSGLWEGINREAVYVKFFHAGRAAQSGMLAAMLASRGVPGARRILNGMKGFLRATSTCTPDRIEHSMETLGKEYYFLHNVYKRYPCCFSNYGAIEAALVIRKSVQSPVEAIRRIEARVKPEATWLVNNPSPETVFDAKFSMQFCIAVTLIFGAITVDHFTPDMIADAFVRALMQRVILISDEIRDGKAPSCELTVYYNTGSTFSALGTPLSMTEEDVREKFRALVGRRVSLARTTRLEKLIMRVEELTDLSEFIATLGGE
jgi:2-methylcitrate dehydratase PrpD